MSRGGNRFLPAFKGDWFDSLSKVSIEPDQRIAPDSAGVPHVYKYQTTVTETGKERITAAEHVVHEASGIGTGSIDMFSHSLPHADIPELAGLATPDSARTMSMSISFSIQGVASMALIKQQKDTAVRYPASVGAVQKA